MYSLMIVDDEMLERRALRKMLEDNFPDVQVLPDAVNGVSLLEKMEEEKPDILLLDINMPLMDGLNALEIIRLKQYPVKVVILTAYSRFDYAQKALGLRASDYILKPVVEEEIVSKIKKVCAEIDQERKSAVSLSEKESLSMDLKGALEQELLLELWTGELRPSCCEHYLKLFGGWPGQGAIAMVRMTEMKEEEAQRFLLRMKRFWLCFGRRFGDVLLLCLLRKGRQESVSMQSQMAGAIEAVKEDAGRAAVGVSSWKSEFEQLQEAVEESRIALQQVHAGLFCFDQLKGNSQNRLDFGKIWKSGFRSGKGDFREKLEKLLAQRQEDGADMEELWTLVFAILQRERFKKERSIFSSLKKKLCWDEIRNCKNIEALREYASGVWEEAADETVKRGDDAETENENIRKSMGYIEQNYMEDLSLDAVAQFSGISMFYLSRLFRQELGRTFLEVLTDVRLIHAVELMETSEMSLAKIAEQVGYQNAGYFYKLFSKNMGIQAGRMREALRNF